MSLSLLTKPRLFLAIVSSNLFLYKTVADRRGIKQRNVFDVLPANDVENIRLGALLSGKAWFWPEASYLTDIVSLCLITRIIKPKIIFEIGTFRGYTALHFALNSPEDAVVYTLDLPRDADNTPKLNTTLVDDEHINAYLTSMEYLFSGTEVEHKIHCLFGDSATFDFSPYYGQVDLFFIDGAHSYEYVRNDTLKALKCVHVGSVIAWHDWGRVGVNGVTRWTLEFAKNYECDVYAVPGGSLAFTVIRERTLAKINE